MRFYCKVWRSVFVCVQVLSFVGIDSQLSQTSTSSQSQVYCYCRISRRYLCGLMDGSLSVYISRKPIPVKFVPFDSPMQ